MAPRVNPHIADGVIALTAYIYAAFDIAAGVLIVLGGRKSWAAPAYHTALQLPGAPASWGIALLAFGVVMFLGLILGHRPAIVIGSALSALWCWFFAITFGYTLFVTPAGVGNLGPLIWGFIGTLFIVRAVAFSRWLQ